MTLWVADPSRSIKTPTARDGYASWNWRTGRIRAHYSIRRPTENSPPADHGPGRSCLGPGDRDPRVEYRGRRVLSQLWASESRGGQLLFLLREPAAHRRR